jgi:hypothetical protein
VVQLPPATHSLQAVFVGVSPFKGSSSATLTETVNKDGTTATLAVGPSFWQEEVLTATVAPVAPGSGVPTGTVAFFENGTFLGSAVVDGNGQATVFLRLPTGKHTVTAIYNGDADFDGSTSSAVTFTI